MTSRVPARNPALTRNASNTLPAPSISQSTASGGTTASTSVRRNLFPQAARRQVQHATSSSSSTITASQHGASSSSDSTSNDIITRDPITGTFTIDSPQFPAPMEPLLEEEEEEARRRLIDSWRKHGGEMVDQNGEFGSAFPKGLEDIMENGIGEDRTRSTANAESLDPSRNIWANETLRDAEIKAVLLASLEAKVQSLDEDGWMFGDEEKDDE